MNTASGGLSSEPRAGLTAVFTLEVTRPAGGLLLSSPHKLGGFPLGQCLLHQLCGRLELAGAFGEPSSHPLGFEL